MWKLAQRAGAALLLTLTTIGTLALAHPSSAQAYALGPHGSWTCRLGFVWREAVPNDAICVPPERRDRSAQENAETASHTDPGTGACRPGYVWREASHGNLATAELPDPVCVTPQVRALVAAENTVGNYWSRALFMTVRFQSELDGRRTPITLNLGGFNPGPVWVGIYRRADGALLWSGGGTAVLNGSTFWSDGSYGFDAATPLYGCWGNGEWNAYSQAYDYLSGLWTNQQPIELC